MVKGAGKMNFWSLKKARERMDGDGKLGRCGNWTVALGGYDTGYEVYFKGSPVARVNYELCEYEIYGAGIRRADIPEFLAAMDAWRFGDVTDHGEADWE